MDFFSFAKKMGRNVGKNISKFLSSEYSQKLLNHAKQSATNALKTASIKAIQNTLYASSDLIGNKIANKITRASKALPQNDLKIKEETLR